MNIHDGRWVPIRLDRQVHARLAAFAATLDPTAVFVQRGDSEANIKRVSLGQAVAILLDRAERHRERGRNRKRTGRGAPPDAVAAPQEADKEAVALWVEMVDTLAEKP